MIKDSKNFAVYAANILDGKKGKDIVIINIRNLTIIADYFVICSGRSSVQVKALCDELEEKLEEMGVELKRKEGYQEGRWIAMDYGNVIVHIFHEEERGFYNLERLWIDGERLYINNEL